MFLKFLSHMMNIRGSLLSQLTFYTSMLLSEHLFKKLSLTTNHKLIINHSNNSCLESRQTHKQTKWPSSDGWWIGFPRTKKMMIAFLQGQLNFRFFSKKDISSKIYLSCPFNMEIQGVATSACILSHSLTSDRLNINKFSDKSMEV